MSQGNGGNVKLINRVRVWVADYLGLVALVRELEAAVGRERRRAEAIKALLDRRERDAEYQRKALQRRADDARAELLALVAAVQHAEDEDYSSESLVALTRAAIGAKNSRSGRRMRPPLTVVGGGR